MRVMMVSLLMAAPPVRTWSIRLCGGMSADPGWALFPGDPLGAVCQTQHDLLRPGTDGIAMAAHNDPTPPRKHFDSLDGSFAIARMYA
jgi:hypothetical protein